MSKQFSPNRVDQAAAWCQCPVCGEYLDSGDQTFSHVRDEHPDAFAELSGLEVVEPAPERESSLDLVEIVERLAEQLARRRHW